MENPQKLATLGTQDTRRRQTKQKHNKRYEHSYTQLVGKANRTSFICGNRSGHYNTELRT